MRHIKPGRGPSMMGGVICAIGSLALSLLGLALLFSDAGPAGWIPFPLSFGAAFLSVYYFKNGMKKNRHSDFDVTDPGEEPDPLCEILLPDYHKMKNGYCPYCGKALKVGNGAGMVYCTHCGKKL